LGKYVHYFAYAMSMQGSPKDEQIGTLRDTLTNIVGIHGICRDALKKSKDRIPNRSGFTLPI